MSDTSFEAALRLTCQPSKTGNALVFPYRLVNEGPGEVYAMQALARGGTPASETAAVVIAGESGEVMIGKFVPPLPTDRRVAVPLVPLTHRLPAGGSLEGRIEITLPLAETSPYFPDLTLRQYEIVEITAVVLMVAYWLADPSEVIARPAAAAPDLLTIHPVNPEARARLARQRFPTHGLQLFRRTDPFPRQFG
jgi:hypothetical protein